MTIELLWKTVAMCAFVAAFIAIGGCIGLTYQLNRVIDIQNQMVEMMSDETTN